MSRFTDSVESQIRAAMERGEFEDLPGFGARLDVSDQGPGWWARRKVDEIRAHDSILELARDIDIERDKIWQLPNVETVRAAVARLNDHIRTVNQALGEGEHIGEMTEAEAIKTWKRMQRLRITS